MNVYAHVSVVRDDGRPHCINECASVNGFQLYALQVAAVSVLHVINTCDCCGIHVTHAVYQWLK